MPTPSATGTPPVVDAPETVSVYFHATTPAPMPLPGRRGEFEINGRNYAETGYEARGRRAESGGKIRGKVFVARPPLRRGSVSCSDPNCQSPVTPPLIRVLLITLPGAHVEQRSDSGIEQSGSQRHPCEHDDVMWLFTGSSQYHSYIPLLPRRQAIHEHDGRARTGLTDIGQPSRTRPLSAGLHGRNNAKGYAKNPGYH